MTTKITEVSDGFETDVDPETYPLTSGVVSVQGKSGIVTLDSDEVPEGVSNLYFTDLRARAAAVTDSAIGEETETAPSVRAVRNLVFTRENQVVVGDRVVDIGDHYLMVDCSFFAGDLLISLPDVALATGRMYVIQKTDSTFFKVLVNDNLALIGGMTTRKLCTQGETITLYSNGSTWIIVGRYIPSVSTQYTPTTLTTFGVVTNAAFFWRRTGSGIRIRAKFTSGTVVAGTSAISLPDGLQAAGTDLIPSIMFAGTLVRNANSTTYFSNTVLIEPLSTVMNFGTQSSTTNGITKLASAVSSTGGLNSLDAEFPIYDWDN